MPFSAKSSQGWGCKPIQPVQPVLASHQIYKANDGALAAVMAFWVLALTSRAPVRASAFGAVRPLATRWAPFTIEGLVLKQPL